MVVGEELQNQVNSGEGCFLTIYNDNPTKEIDNNGSQKSKNHISSSNNRPLWLNFFFYLFCTLFGMGWILRLSIFMRGIGVNIFMRKVVLR